MLPAAGQPLHCLILERTGATACSLAERLSGCAAQQRLDVSTADGVCTACLALINEADGHYQRYQVSRLTLRGTRGG